jgi:hypothetical protein
VNYNSGIERDTFLLGYSLWCWRTPGTESLGQSEEILQKKGSGPPSGFSFTKAEDQEGPANIDRLQVVGLWLLVDQSTPTYNLCAQIEYQ